MVTTIQVHETTLELLKKFVDFEHKIEGNELRLRRINH